MAKKTEVKKLRAALHDEKAAIKYYTKTAAKSTTGTAKLLRHIAKDERHHRDEITKKIKFLNK